jgi:hypothetical protein
MRLLLGGQIKENEMKGSCSAHGTDEKCVENFSRKDRDHLGNLGVYWKIILKWTLKEYDLGV